MQPNDRLPRREAARTALLLFTTGLLVRCLGWACSAERDLPFAASYQGDAPYWQRAAAVAAGTAAPGFENVLPFRPPAMAWLSSALWNGDADTAWRLRVVLLVLGALVAPLTFAALRHAFAARTARLAGWICTWSGSLLQLGTGIHGELPYLLLFLLGAADCARLARERAPIAAGRWAVVNGLACLFRADHLLYCAAAMAWWLLRRRAAAGRDIGIAAATMGLVLTPWQWRAAAAVADFNALGTTARPAVDVPSPGSLPWTDDAIAAVRAMPASARGATFGFVDATVRTRGGSTVTAAELQVLDEAYDSRPEPLGTPILALYGPLNFFLANSPESDGGFTRAPLDRRPPLLGGLERYPPGLLDVLPHDGALQLGYPPHLDAINHGYRRGFAFLGSQPLRGLRLLGKKIAQAWRGAAAGIGSMALPCGRSGVREPVDLTVAEHLPATVWRGALLVLAGLGWWRCRHNPETAGWTIWLATKFAIVAAFFGYARLGALCVPTLALFWAAALDDLRLPLPWQRRFALLLGIALAAAEVGAALTSHQPTVDGVPFVDAKSTLHARVHVGY